MEPLIHFRLLSSQEESIRFCGEDLREPRPEIGLSHCKVDRWWGPKVVTEVDPGAALSLRPCTLLVIGRRNCASASNRHPVSCPSEI